MMIASARRALFTLTLLAACEHPEAPCLARGATRDGTGRCVCPAGMTPYARECAPTRVDGGFPAGLVDASLVTSQPGSDTAPVRDAASGELPPTAVAMLSPHDAGTPDATVAPTQPAIDAGAADSDAQAQHAAQLATDAAPAQPEVDASPAPSAPAMPTTPAAPVTPAAPAQFCVALRPQCKGVGQDADCETTGVWTLYHDVHGRVAEKRSADGASWRYYWRGETHNLAAKLAPSGDAWGYSWNAAGVLVEVKGPNGATSTCTP
jgi:YD repeat-containing protein